MSDPKGKSRRGENDFDLVVWLHAGEIHLGHGLHELGVVQTASVVAGSVLHPHELASGSGFGWHGDGGVVGD